MRRLVVAAGCALIASVLFATTAAGQTGVLAGAIYDQTSKIGLPGVTVKVTGTDLVATTGPDGRFTIAGIPAGSHGMEATQTGFRPFRLPIIRVGTPDTARVFLSLAPMPEESTPVEATSETALGKISENGPMYVVDGVIFAGGTMPSKIPPADIISVEVIKGDAAQKMYGEVAGTGVIMITTRKAPPGGR
jgi:hypothetical protein